MPHFIIDCSKGVAELVASEKIIQKVYDTAVDSGLFAKEGLNGVKVRISPFKDFTIVNSQENFIHVFAHILEGRTDEQKQKLSESVVNALADMLPTVKYMSMNVYEFQRSSYYNKSMV